MYRHVLFIAALLFAACVPSEPLLFLEGTRLRSGDLLFQNLEGSELCKAIEDVTRRQFEVTGPDICHVGILSYENGAWVVYEAWDGVERKSLRNFMIRPKFRVTQWHAARVKNLSAKQWLHVRNFLQSQVGIPYDPDFLSLNGRYYCSELVLESFNATSSQPLFQYSPMFYGDPKNPTDNAYNIWSQYFKSRNQKVPSGKPGVSPLGLYLSDAVNRIK